MATSLRRLDRYGATVVPFITFFEGVYARWAGTPGLADFAVGNPHEMPLPGYVDALHRHLEPQDPGLVRLQDERAERPGGRRPDADRADRTALGSRPTWR